MQNGSGPIDIGTIRKFIACTSWSVTSYWINLDGPIRYVAHWTCSMAVMNVVPGADLEVGSECQGVMKCALVR